MPGLSRPLLLILLIAGFPAICVGETFTSPFGIEFTRIPAGEFIMGTQDFAELEKAVGPERLHNLRKEGPAHRVVISKDFFMATTETTQAVWYAIMDHQPGKEVRWEREDWKRLPVSRVSWEDVQEFLKIVNERDPKYRYRLPTEAEWEYAARAGSTGLRPFPLASLGEHVWYLDSSDDDVQPVATRKPNAWGLYDVIGNLWEWVEDSYDRDYYEASPTVDPPGPALSEFKVMRGGSYHCELERARVGIRVMQKQDRHMSVLGFRLAAEVKN
jgi:sulfatase modifying factor 1